MTDKNREIEEMAKTLCGEKENDCRKCYSCGGICEFWMESSVLYNAGYRKQSEGEWEQQPRPYEDEIVCSVCGANFNIIDNCTEKFDFCPNCGARMTKGDEGK